MFDFKFARLFSVLALCGTSSSLCLAEVPSAITHDVSKAVVLVEARGCNGDTPERNGSGFAFGNSSDVVTAYHVVAGCSNITLWYEYVNGTPFRQTRISHVLRRNDLALLHVDQPPSGTYLTGSDHIDDDADFKALGYGDGSPSMGDLDLRISFGNNSLRQMLPVSNLQQISNTAIDASQRVIRFSRPLQPGMSGGPIFDRDGKVIAIVAGGLKSGAVPSSWGWPAGLIVSLRQSNEMPDASARMSATLFAFGVSKTTGGAIADTQTRTCGGLEFQQGADVSFGDAAKSSDDTARLMTTIMASGVPQREIVGFQFNTWVHHASGATVVVPEGFDLEEVDGNCVAQSDDGTFQEIVRATPASTPQEVQLASVEFENTVMAPSAMPNMGWYADNVLTQGLPRTRADGLVVNRKALFVAKQMLAPGRFRAIHQFETIMARGGSFVGIGMINNNVEQCFNSFNQPVLCVMDPEYLRTWARFVLATQMSTYPVY